MICLGCMNSDRKMLHITSERERECFLQIIKNIPMPVPVKFSLYLCWECTALIVRFTKFQDQVMKSYKVLNDIKPQRSFDSICKPESGLKRKELFNLSYKPEETTEYFVELVKVESPKEDIDSDIKAEILNYDDEYDDIKIEICEERKRKKIMKGGTKIKKEGSEYKQIELTPEELEEERKNLANNEEYINAMFRCEKCIKSFSSEKSFNDHIYIKHEMHASLLTCKICECSFISEVAYNYHMNRHMKRFECTVCGERFRNNLSAIRHHDVKHGLGEQASRRYICELCSKKFAWRGALRDHLERHNIASGEKRRPYCELCKLSFTSTLNLKKHIKKSTSHQIQLNLRKLKEKLSEERNEERRRARVEQIRSAVMSEQRQYACVQCGQRFQWQGNLQRHMKNHAIKAQGGLVCVPCNRRFSSVATYKHHLAISKEHVTEDRLKFICSDCGCRFTMKAKLKEHILRTHLDTLDHEHTCNTCQKVFISSKSLTKHMQTVHNKEHLCDQCGKSFPCLAKLKAHLEIHNTGDGQEKKPYCAPCKISFSTALILQNHVENSSKHQIQLRKLELLEENGSVVQREQLEQIRNAVNSERQRFPCPQCGKMFQWRCNLQRHIESHAIRAQGGLLCVPCNRSFSSVATYKQHMTTAKAHITDMDLKFVCSECGERFATKKLLKNHVECTHFKSNKDIK